MSGMIAGAVMVVVIAVMGRRRRAFPRGGEVTDEMIERIESAGTVEVEEPLDLEHAAAEEERFWAEAPWDEPEEP